MDAPPSSYFPVSLSSRLRVLSLLSLLSVLSLLCLPLWLSAFYVNLGRIELARAALGLADPAQGYRRAAGYAEQALEWNGGNGRGYLLLGIARLGERRPAEGVAALERAVELEPGDEAGHLHLAEAYRDLGEMGRAVEEWRAAGAGTALRERGLAARNGKDAERAEQWYALATLVAPEDVRAWLGLAQVRAERGEWWAAAATYGEMVRRFPESRYGYEGQADLLYSRVKDRAGALAVLDDGIGRSTDPKQQMYYLRSVYRAADSRWAESEEDARRAIELAPGNGGYLLWLGDLYLRQNRYEEAVAQYRAAGERASDRSYLWRAWQREGSVYASLKRWPEAVECYRLAAEASERQGAKPEVVAGNWVQLGAQLTAAGRGAEAEAAFGRALELDPTNADAARRLQEQRGLTPPAARE